MDIATDREGWLFIDGHNLINQEAREHTSFLKDIVPRPGRSIRAGLAHEFWSKNKSGRNALERSGRR